jgi:tetratricopeptide (TPR) repeat protein
MISEKTLRRAKASGQMSPGTLACLAAKLGTPAETLLAEWSGRTFEQREMAKLQRDESVAAEAHFTALAHNGLHDDAVAFARETLARAEAAGDHYTIAYWADRTADAYRAMGALRDSSAFYARAWEQIQLALQQSPRDVELRYQAGKTRFGRIMVDDCMVRGAFREAWLRYDELLKDAEELIREDAVQTIRAAIAIRILHIKRQQSEMVRLLGHYSEALVAIRQVATQYPEEAYEARAYSGLYEADSLRLLGELDTALQIYSGIEQFARSRDTPGLLASTLWRMSCALKQKRRPEESEKTFTEATAIAEKYPQRYRFLSIYCRLAEASGETGNPRRALKLLDEAEALGQVTSDYLVLEYAHIALCRAEVLRREPRKRLESLGWFRTAFSTYRRMDCRWGVVRAWIGLQLTGDSEMHPAGILNVLEGIDARLLAEFDETGEIEYGGLSTNIP